MSSTKSVIRSLLGYVMLSEDKHLYSVPYRYHRKAVRIAYTATNVEIYLGEEADSDASPQLSQMGIFDSC